jgi:hypothetical protein
MGTVTVETFHAASCSKAFAMLSQKSSVPQAAKFVSQALKRDSRPRPKGPAARLPPPN